MASLHRFAACILCLAIGASRASRAEVADAAAAPPVPAWDLAARSLVLAPGELGDGAAGPLAGRAFDASLWHRSGLGVAVDGEYWRTGQGAAGREALLADAGLGVRALQSGSLRFDLLAGARIDAGLAAGSTPWDESSAAAGGASPMAGARATLGLAEGVSLAVRGAVAPDAELDAAWRFAGTLRIDLDAGWALVLDARWHSAAAAAIPGTGLDAGAADGRGSVWAGLSLSF
jgi:hypothetical protein